MSNILESYINVAGHQAIEQLLHLAKPLKDLKMVHINSTKKGGGVAEILMKMVPIMEALGIQCQWEIITGSSDFYNCTKSFHNALQGNHVLPSKAYLNTFEQVNAENAAKYKQLLQDADVVFIHDPQPVAMIEHFPQRMGKWIWRCHIDASRPYRPVWSYLKKYIEKYDATIFSLAQFCQPLSLPMHIILPSIDPLSAKNRELSPAEIQAEMQAFNIDQNRPVLLQVSRFDRFKDPVGVIEAYRLVKKFNPLVQLVLAGGGASDDPEGEVVLQEVKRASEDDPDIHVLLLPDDAHTTINALQRSADIILQKSIKEGFGLTVSEGLWKGKPVIGGNVGGIRKQIINWQSGFLVNTPEGAAYRIRYLLQYPDKVLEMGHNGKKYVQENFLITRQVRDYLALINTLYVKSDRIEINDSFAKILRT